ncbi:MAG: STAS domain-containing protein [Acidimicrobiales bacterium]
MGHSCSIDESAGGPVIRVVVEGEIDMACASEVTDTLVAASQRDGVAHVVADLAGVTFLDSMGISALVSAKRALEETGQDLTLAAVPSMVAQVLKIAGVDGFLPIEP